ncbi:hypothetical protein BDN70DRAFT_873826 [Pholiota conissans]|uniref:Uncharacterized protein n=1 Tax=Pholiota conissans TaxID=109636 RepID=A0A9P5Z9D6_9AGAR|nr:hypothetical protein BDN70DRAFT_873826 [Pholiota conissans]
MIVLQTPASETKILRERCRSKSVLSVPPKKPEERYVQIHIFMKFHVNTAQVFGNQELKEHGEAILEGRTTHEQDRHH